MKPCRSVSRIIFIFCLFFLELRGESWSQSMLSPEQAMQEALQHNFSIFIFRNDAAIAENDITPGNAGMLPTLNLNANATLGQTSFKQVYTTGTELNRNNAGSKNATAGLGFSWTIFDGMKMFTTYERLKEFASAGDLNAKMQVEKNDS